MSPLTGVGEILDELGGGGKQSLETVLDGAVCDGDRQMGFATAGFARQDQRSSFGDKVRSEVGTEERLPKSRLQSEIELIDGLEEGEMRAAREALQAGLLASCDFFGKQKSEEVAIGPIFFFGSMCHLLVDAAHVREVETLEQSIELRRRKLRSLGHRIVHLCCGHRSPLWPTRQLHKAARRSAAG